MRGAPWRVPDGAPFLFHVEAEALAMWRQATTAPVGHPTTDKINNDNVIIKPEQGNSRAYTLDRLKDERPERQTAARSGRRRLN